MPKFLDGIQWYDSSGALKNLDTELNTINNKFSSYVPTSRTINGHALTGNVTVTKSDVGLANVANERQYSANNPPTTSMQTESNTYTLTPATYSVGKINTVQYFGFTPNQKYFGGIVTFLDYIGLVIDTNSVMCIKGFTDTTAAQKIINLRYKIPT